MAKILIFSPHPIQPSMAGPAIRSWEFAKELAKNHEVVLISEGEATAKSDQFLVISSNDPSLETHYRTASVAVTQVFARPLAKLVMKYGLKVIIDAYDPLPLEAMELHSQHRDLLVSSAITNLIFSFSMADGILCASERQRNLWIGFLMGLRLINPERYDEQINFRHFIDVVPFGLPSTPPKRSGAIGLREKYGFNADDKVILWGGGIWDWFDPLSLIKAMKLVSTQRKDVKLVFMGVKSPDPNVVEFTMAGETMELALTLGLTGKSVFFNAGWVPYEERQNMLLDADIGVSTHFDHLETTFSFRTRMLDYIWAQLPIIATEGDSFAEVINQHDLGIVVPYKDEEAIAQAILSLVDDHGRREQIKQHHLQLEKELRWEQQVKPLSAMIERLSRSSKGRSYWQDRKRMARYLMTKVKEMIQKYISRTFA